MGVFRFNEIVTSVCLPAHFPPQKWAEKGRVDGADLGLPTGPSLLQMGQW